VPPRGHWSISGETEIRPGTRHAIRSVLGEPCRRLNDVYRHHNSHRAGLAGAVKPTEAVKKRVIRRRRCPGFMAVTGRDAG
jgi:hypothetical protein